MTVVVLAVIIVWAFTEGAYPVEWNDVMSAVLGKNESAFVLFEIRMPRVIGAAAVGAILGMSGLSLQAMMRNDLAEPSLLGISSGAALMAGIAIIIMPIIQLTSSTDMRGMLMALFAFIGALSAVFAVQRLSRIQHRVDVQQLILTGVAINAICGAGAGVLSYLSNDEQLRSITFWTLGSFGGLNQFKVFVLLCLAFLLFISMRWNAKQLNLMTLGEYEAMHLGVSVEKLKRRMILLVSLCVGVAVAFCGIIGFIGLVIPHIVRLLVGSNHEWTVPYVALIGALVMVLADMISRTVVLPSELPVGIVTAMMGAPFFIHLLRKNQRRNQIC
jgi:iron complex transport system permease protein